jgi:hypothetical protein
MKKRIFLAALALVTASIAAYAGGKGDGTLRKSRFPATFPQPFTNFPTLDNTNNSRPNKTNMAVSTGYYVVDSDDDAGDFWRPNLDRAFLNRATDTDPAEIVKWKRIISGPNQTLTPNETVEGQMFFRNPNQLTDSVDNAFAGPIRIGFPFFMNGVRYDSFYVSTNGIISLSNPRYTYNELGQRTGYNIYRDDILARPASGIATTDPVPDNYGFQFFALGNSTAATGGIRNTGAANMANLPADIRNAPAILPAFGNLQLSQSPDLPEEQRGQVWFKRADNPDGTRRMIIYYQNVAPIGAWASGVGGPVTFTPNDQRILANFQVTLDQSDSSVYVYFERLEGSVVVNGISVSAAAFFRMNTTIGVNGTARHYSFKFPNCNSNLTQTEFQATPLQYTQYLSRGAYGGGDVSGQLLGPAGHGSNTPANGLAIRFKQWRNVVRVIPEQIRYFGRELISTANLDQYTRQIVTPEPEIYAGHPQLGAIRPTAAFQNMTNDIQGPGVSDPLRPSGVNYTVQDLNFRVRMRIINQATNITAYSRSVPIGVGCLSGNCPPDVDARVEYGTTQGAVATGNFLAAGAPGTGIPAFPGTGPCPLNGIPPYGVVRVQFPPFEPNELLDFQIGRLRLFVFSEGVDSIFRSIGDEWPFDDTVSRNLYVMRRLSFLNSDGFSDDANEYYVIGGTPMPSVLKWVNYDAEVANGDEETFNPPPPRWPVGATPGSLVPAKNRPTFRTTSPVIKLNRVTLGGDDPSPQPGGDQIRSFPIDIRNLPNRRTQGSILTVSYQRTGNKGDFGRGWSDATIIGPEPRVIFNGVLTSLAPGGTPDEMRLEYARPSTNNIENIARQFNDATTDIQWNVHRRRVGAAVTDNFVFSAFGAGGSRIGYLPDDKDSALTAAQGLRPDIFDDGKDVEFKKIFFRIPDSVIFAPNEGARDFRFRLRVSASRNTAPPQPQDDDDDFYVDNVKLIYTNESPDIEMSLVEVLWPYQTTPASQMTQLPIRFKITNNTGKQSPSVSINVKVLQESDPITKLDAYYCRSTIIPFVRPGQIVESTVPAWNARRCPPGRYRIVANCFVQGGDVDNTNDTTYSFYTLRYGPVFAYDPPTARNDVPDFTQGATGNRVDGRGLNTEAYSSGLWPNFSTQGTFGVDFTSSDGRLAFGPESGSASGQFAMRFQLLTQDTIKGFQAWMGEVNQSPDPIAFALYRGTDAPQAQPIAGTKINKFRGYDDIRKDLFYGQYTTYLFDQPVVLPPGEYWASIAQLGLDGISLGASRARVGQIITHYNINPPGPGISGVHLNLDKSFRQLNAANQLINKNVFAYERTAFSGTWVQATPLSNPMFGHLAHDGNAAIQGWSTSSRGTWLPLLRPFLGDKSFSQTPTPDDNCVVPVELTYFDGQKRKNGVELFWQTATEENNAGFHVERRVVRGDEPTNWASIQFIRGAGNSTVVRNYSVVDDKVMPGVTYQYRLTQMDLTGTESCKAISDVLEFTTDESAAVALEQNVPNPFSNSTNISFFVKNKAVTKLEVVDMFGRIIRTLFDGTANAGRTTVEWDGTDNSGATAPTGTYIYRLTSGNNVEIAKMTLTR